MGQRHLGFVLVTFALVGCKKEPTTITAHQGAFQLTLPPGWSSSEEPRPTLDHLTARPPDGDGVCALTFTEASGVLNPDQFLENFRTGAMKSFSATQFEPDSIEVARERFGAVHFKGHPPGKGVMGALASLAGEASVELSGGALGSTYVGVMVATFDTTKDKQGVVDGCHAVARSLKDLRAASIRPTETHAPPRVR